MITILKRGTRKTTRCPHCGALLRYEGEDVENKLEIFGWRDSFTRSTIVCPQCKHKIEV